MRIYNERFGESWTPTDVRTVRVGDIPEHDIMCAGFPCQSFSIAGRRQGFGDTRGTLFYEICRIAEEHRTPYLFLENVRGLLSNDRGRTFEIILSTLDEMGYRIQWEVLNSKHFGVPQNRERVFIIANLRNKPVPQVFPIGQSGRRPTEVERTTDKEEVANAITAPHKLWGRGNDTLIVHNIYGGFEETEPRIFTEYSPTIRTPAGGGHIPAVIEPSTSRVRRLTPTECERLQGFPDGWTACEGVSDTQRYKVLGNAVTVNVVQAIVERWMSDERGESDARARVRYVQV